MVSSNGSFRSLQSLHILCAHFIHGDWKTILDSIGYSSLEVPSLFLCGLLQDVSDSLKKQEYRVADLCRNVGEYHERAAILVAEMHHNDIFTFSRKDRLIIME